MNKLILTTTLVIVFAGLAVFNAVTAEIVGGKDWELPQAHFRDNGLRGDVVLNGFWAGRPAGSDEEFKKVRVPAGNGKSEHYREFTLPKGWENRRVTLEVGGFTKDGVVTLDGKTIAEIPAQKRWVEIELPLKKGSGATYRLGINAGGINDDIWLRSYPKSAPAIDETYITTSYRNMEARVKIAGSAPKMTELQPVVRIYSDPNEKKLVKTIKTPGTIIVGESGQFQIELATPWKNPKLWSRWHPNLYYYTVDLVKGRKVVDKVLPRRFGFREVWIENGRLMLNGIPISTCSEVWEISIGTRNVMREQAETMLRNLKKMGITTGTKINSDTMFNIGDEIGMLFFIHAGSMVQLNIWNPRSGLTDMSGDENAADITRLIERWREHPSIMIWRSNAPYTLISLHPFYAGQDFEPWYYFPLNRNTPRSRKGQLIFKKMVDLVAKVDPARSVATTTSPFSPMETATRYLCYDLDLQEREEHFDHWFRSSRPKAIFFDEFNLPFQGHYYMRYIDHQMPGGPWINIYIELAARYLGDRVYLTDPDEELKQWPSRIYPTYHRKPVVQQFVSEQIRGTWRSWRTYGISAGAQFIISASGCDVPMSGNSKNQYSPKESKDPRKPGLSRVVGGGRFPILGVDKIFPAGEEYLKAVKPLMVYIGGPDTFFTNKDHLYYTGSLVRKALIVVNDWDDPAELTGSWKLIDANGKVVQSGKLNGTVKPGRRAYTEFPIKFDAPKVAQRADYTIEVKMTANMPGTLEDSFDITVFPKQQSKTVKFSGNVWRLNISDDRTHETLHFIHNRDNKAFLKAAGVEANLIKGLKTFEYRGYDPGAAGAIDRGRKWVTEGTPKPGDLLIIPRHTLKTQRDDRQLNYRLLHKMGLDKLIEQGLRVIVFEQDLPNVFGVVTEDVRPRRVFMAAKGHPIFDGLAPGDLTYWTGDSDLAPAMAQIPVSEWEFADRMWHSSNTNSVATRTLIRPQVGSVRALAVSGFDLAESPLLEVTRGKGRILFCMMDVTNRYGKDPAATTLVDNIFKYMATVEDADPAKSTVDYVQADGEAVVNKKQVFRAAKPEGQHSWGITQGELFFRESIYEVDEEKNRRTGKLADVPVPVFADSAGEKLPQVIRFNPDSGKYMLTLDESLFKTGWSKRKVAWLRSALIVNQGGSTTEGPGIAHHGNIINLYPIAWVENFVHPYTADLW